ncbi:laminin subunit alpha-5-like [Salvelinus sp. IW2-2015]|uniref:laminin subunit alpha-5-like n=1 Tax=Salvelinus sp. IW2-2015 TaxID=2691554 RepID=UPI000CEABF9C|nr:laminin subunit alpha-5-like [Salvelinus alpinus]
MSDWPPSLDGARIALAEKVQTFAPTLSKIPLVEAAEEHAELLTELARNLSSVISNTNKDGFIQRAVNASRAYSDIIAGVRDAEIAANQAAVDAPENVKGQELGQVADGLRNHSSELLREAVTLQQELNNDLKPRLLDAMTRLDEAKQKHKTLLKDLEMVQSNLNFSREETAKVIEEAKAAAEEANSTAAKVEDTLAPIKEQVDQWQRQYGDANTTNEDINKAFLEANKSVGMLGEAIPILMKKLDKLQNHSAQMPNISENILRIRQLIAGPARPPAK